MLKHPFANASARLVSWNLGPIELLGTDNTVAAAGVALGSSDVDWVHLVRMVVPLNDLNAAILIHPGGAIGHPLHPERDGQLKAWTAQEPVPFLWDNVAIDAAAVHRVVIAP